jgi:arabinogalactan oligomer/maltooligosaccharide transport system permease protein
MASLNFTVIAGSLLELAESLLVLFAVFVVIELLIYFVVGKWLKSKQVLVYMLIAPGMFGLLLLVVYPIAFEFGLAFSNMSLRTFRNPEFGLQQGIANFVRVFTKPVLKQSTIYPIFLRTMLWTVMQVSVHVSMGLMIAILLNTNIKGKNIYKALLILPWAIPDVISGLAWRGEFHFEYGFINIILQRIGLEPLQWKANPVWNFLAMNITNWWLGIPFMMVICLGGLQSISKEYYEAAEMDGASGVHRFYHITLPLMKPVLTPAIVLGIIWTFNNFNVPYFINQFELETSDILVTALFRAAFEYNQYGFSAAFAVVIFAILLGISLIYMRISGGLRSVR